jgi:hypothetical protein
MSSYATYNDGYLPGLMKEGDQAALTEIYFRYWSEEDRRTIMYTIDGLIQHARTRQAYK